MIANNEDDLGRMTFAELGAMDVAPIDFSAPLQLREITQRPLWIGGLDLDEVDEKDLCCAFANQIWRYLKCLTPEPAIELTKESLSQLPDIPGVYLLHAPLDDRWTRSKIVYIGKAKSLHHRWNNSEHHRLQEAIAWKCRLNWFGVERGTEGLVEAALIYELKPAWNER